jgi:ABC-type polysaccharide transport system permease subunit
MRKQKLIESADLEKIWHILYLVLCLQLLLFLFFVLVILSTLILNREFLLKTSAVRNVSDVIVLYDLDYGIEARRFSFEISAGTYKSLISLFLLFSANKLSKKLLDIKLYNKLIEYYEKYIPR